MKIDRIKIVLLMMAALACSLSGFAQKKEQIAEKKVLLEVLSVDGKPISCPEIFTSRSRHHFTAGTDGKVMISFRPNDALKVRASGYETTMLEAKDLPEKTASVRLMPVHKYEDADHQLYTVTGDAISELRTVGAFSKVDGAALEQTPGTYFWDAIGQRLGGLFYSKSSMAPGWESWDGFVRAPNGGSPIVMIDGVERSLDYVEPEIVESVELLKDASLKAMFGGYHTNGILQVKTRRGLPYENSVRANVQTGVEIPNRLPHFLNARDYAMQYNQALRNQGMNPLYDPFKYDGSNSLLYPDVDYYSQFLNEQMKITRASTQLSGGTDNTQYFAHLGFQNNGGFEAYTDHPNNDQIFTVKGNVDNTILGFIDFQVGIHAALEMRTWPNMSTQDFFNMLSGIRPNEFPITIPGSLVGSDKEYVYGGSSTIHVNPLGQLVDNGYVKREFSYLLSDFSVNVDLDRWVKGLSIRPSVTFDFYNEFSSRKNGGYTTTELLNVADTVGGHRTWGYAAPSTSLVRGGNSTNRSWMFRTIVNYDRTFGKSAIKATALYFRQKHDFSSHLHSLKREQFGVSANYMFDRRYVLDAGLNYVGVPSFAPAGRFGLFPNIGAGWMLSEEGFLKDLPWMDYLKLRASYGTIGSTLYGALSIVSDYYYKDAWLVEGSYPFSAFSDITVPDHVGNAAVTFQRNRELNAGVDFDLLGSLSGSVTFFHNSLYGGITNLSALAPGVSGKGYALPWQNYNEYVSSGVEVSLTFAKHVGELFLSAGGNFSYGKSRVIRNNAINYSEAQAGLRSEKVLGDIRGYRVAGTFLDQADIDASPFQTFGKVYPGDLKYEDINGDGKVDESDRPVLGNTNPEISYGLSISLKYKGFNLDVIGYGLAGFDRFLTNSYYQNRGSSKYSTVVEQGLPNGNPHPVLRAENLPNNFQISDWWKVDGGYFKVQNVELGYTFPHALTWKLKINAIKVFVRGNNLFTVSKIHDLDPENLNCGVGNFPLFTTLTGGITLTL